jgi:hypothetical protein
MPHPLVLQLRFTRREFQRALKGVTDDEARRRFEPMNCIAWNIGHLAWQEQRYWLQFGQDRVLLPEINKQFANGAPACTPALADAWNAWHAITAAADPWLDTLTTAQLQATVANGSRPGLLYGSLLQRVIYHYWYHTGENMAIRQMLGHTRLPEFVGNIDSQAPYRAE